MAHQLLYLEHRLLRNAPQAVGIWDGKSASKIGSSTSIAAVNKIRFFSVEMPNGLSLVLVKIKSMMRTYIRYPRSAKCRVGQHASY